AQPRGVARERTPHFNTSLTSIFPPFLLKNHVCSEQGPRALPHRANLRHRNSSCRSWPLVPRGCAHHPPAPAEERAARPRPCRHSFCTARTINGRPHARWNVAAHTDGRCHHSQIPDACDTFTDNGRAVPPLALLVCLLSHTEAHPMRSHLRLCASSAHRTRPRRPPRSSCRLPRSFANLRVAGSHARQLAPHGSISFAFSTQHHTRPHNPTVSVLPAQTSDSYLEFLRPTEHCSMYVLISS
ncbi:hypothetical protein BJY52DRAFT_1401652, partial [Lactarius psammicola]